MLVQGAGGGVATALIVLGRAAGLRVWATSRSEAKRARALSLGADAAFEPGARLPERVDVVAETVGAATWDHSLKSLKPGGTLVISGATSGGDPPAGLNRVFFLQLSVVGSTMGTRDELDRLVRLCVERDVRPVIEASVPMADARTAFEALARRRRLRQARRSRAEAACAGRRRDLPRFVRAAGPDGGNAVGQAAPVHRCQQLGPVVQLSNRIVRLVTWNVAGRVRAHPSRRRRSRRSGPTSSRSGGDGPHRAAVARRAGRRGLRRVRVGGRRAARRASRRRLAVLTAARVALERVAAPPDVPWPERVLCCAVGRGRDHQPALPIAPAPELAKIRTHEAVAAHLAARRSGPRVLCGD